MPRYEEELVMTKQAELKKQAYESNLKSRALSVLIYLIDRSNKEFTCFPAISTMAEQLHISVSTVKRALHELVDAGYVKKESRYREKNKGQTSNLYTLVLLSDSKEPNCEYSDLKGNEKGTSELIGKPQTKVIEHIDFNMIKKQKEVGRLKYENARKQRNICSLMEQKVKCVPHASSIDLKGYKRNIAFNYTVNKKIPFKSCFTFLSLWTGEEAKLLPP